METSLFQDYIPNGTLDNDTPNGDNGINDNYDDDDYDDDEDYVNDSNRNKDRSHHNGNDNSYNNGNGDQTIMMCHAIHFREHFACDKTEFCESANVSNDPNVSS